jgi:hypothetical protein
VLRVTRERRSKHNITSQLTAKMIAIHSKGGMTFVWIDRIGQVAHRGMASPPTHVQTIGGCGRHERAGEVRVPKQAAVSVLIIAVLSET